MIQALLNVCYTILIIYLGWEQRRMRKDFEAKK